MKRWKSVFGVLLLFLLGFVSGLSFERFANRGHRPSPDQFLIRMEEAVVRELKLNPEQTAVLDQAVREAQKEMQELHRSVRPKLDAILDEAQDKLLPVLTDEQKATLAEMRRRHKERVRRFGDEEERRGVE